MKLTSQEKSSVLKAYNAYWEYYVTGDVSGLASLLDDDYTQIGSVEGEVFNNKKDAVQFVQSTIDQIAGKVDMRNRKIELEPVEHSVLITEQTDLYILIDGGWNFYAKFRASSLMQKKGDQWIFIHQHSSMPDLRADEGENIASEKIAKENLELRDAVKRRTIELEQKNLELAMESALERVRAVAMGMRKLDELTGICEILYNELQQMGFSELRNAMINIHDDDNGSFVNYDFSHEIGRSINHLNYNIHPVLEKQFKEIRSTNDAFSETVYKGKDLEDWKAFRKEVGEKDDPRMDSAVALHYYFYSVGTASIGISTFSAITQEKLQQLKRFRNVFDFAYRRYTDVAQAEAQARESQIQLALERVRARTMAMQHSSELKDAASLLFQQVKDLGIEAWTCGYNIWDEDRKTVTSWLSRGVIQPPFKIPITENPTLNHFYEAAQRGESLFVEEVGGETLTELYRFLGKQLEDAGVSETIRQPGYNPPASQVNHAAFFSYGHLLFVTYKPYPEAHDIFKRFAKVFEQTYTRFLDLENAEHQAREAQIEAALERVRSKTMAMHNSNDVGETVATMFDEFVKLGIRTNRCGILIFGDSPITEVWTAKNNPEGRANLIIGNLDITMHPMLDNVYKAWQQRQSFFNYHLSGNDILDYYQAINSMRGYPVRFDLESIPSQEVHSDFYFKEGAVFAFTDEPIPGDSLQVLMRFAGVFGQTYRRYMDLQKAEAQAWEATIEASLEKVRGRAMAMHKSNELLEAGELLYNELSRLGISKLISGYVLMGEDEKLGWNYGVNPSNGSIMPHPVGILHSETEVTKSIASSWKKQEPFLVIELDPQATIEHQTYIAEHSINYPITKEQLLSITPERLVIHTFNFRQGYLLIAGELLLTAEQQEIVARFAKVFEMTYRRFLDLKQAEAQARESTIEASLERVRYQAMAMQNSDDVGVATATMFIELDKLGIENIRCGIAIISPDQTMEVWSTANTEEGKVIRNAGFFDMNEHPLWQRTFKGWNQKEVHFNYYLTGEEKQAYFKILSMAPGYVLQYELHELPDQYFQSYFFPEGSVWSFSLIPHTEEQNKVFQRFTTVFSLTFRRYMDLKKAEAQAREATIEAALEKVRGKAMAMHNSNDLPATAGMVFSELRKLGIQTMRCGVSIQTKSSRRNLLYSATESEEGDKLSLSGWAILDNHPVLTNIYNHWIKGEDYFPVLNGEELKDYYEKVQSNFAMPDNAHTGHEQYGFYLAFSEGTFYGWAEKPFTEEEIRMLHRFNAIIELTFRRYMELKKSEANALEVVRRASLDRVRAETASMRNAADLERITPMIWNELTTLGVPFIRCGVFIMDESHELIHTFLSTPDGKAIASFHLPFHSSADLWETVLHWRKKEIYQQYWDEAAFGEWTQNLIQQGFIASSDAYATEHRPANLYLHFLPFMQGMLYVGNDTALNENDLHLVQNLSDAFSTAYARYEDFNRLEAAKEQVDKTLTDLRQAQSQLVQAEKMASLGELTAGIAHEIQNPLNFVNNFSDINQELSDEILEAAKRGDITEIQLLAADIKSNQEKISEHGRRADSIVKGMLQHSRSSSGVKEPADINKLADEYLRLAYHGLRAKDKSFNSTLQTDFDPAIGLVPVTPQDIGRVLLNLYNNAFYAVAEKKKLQPHLYEPGIYVSTKLKASKVEVMVKDNGMGIPAKVKDKIFQPFFTTKPTGQGTGLGLSLSYDIIKAHNGEMSVESAEGEGTIFTVILPVK